MFWFSAMYLQCILYDADDAIQCNAINIEHKKLFCERIESSVNLISEENLDKDKVVETRQKKTTE